ncbi:hypothetical protein ACHQM5_007631 [Ranunculus cassubicifolius]
MGGIEEKKEEKKEAKKEGDGIITALYKLNLHCLQCAKEIKRPLMRTQGVHKVDYSIEKNEIKVTGKFEGKKIHEQIQKISKTKVEMTLVTKSDNKVVEKKDKKELVTSITTFKVFMHCAKCEYDLRKTILKLEGVYNVKSDLKAETMVVEGTIEPSKLVKYIHKKIGKHAEIVIKKAEKKVEEKKEAVKEVKVKEVDVKIVETNVLTYLGEEKKVEVKSKESTAPYFVHYVYAPQTFSDENPNACSIM